MPSTGSIYVAPQSNLSVGQIGKLLLTYGGNSFSFDKCTILQRTSETSSSGRTIWGFHFVDIREQWKLGAVSGNFNTRIEGMYKEGDERGRLIRPETIRTPRQILTDIFQYLGIRNPNVSQVPIDILPEISWDCIQPNRAIDDICDQTGCRIVLQPNNKVLVARVGYGKQLPKLPAQSFAIEFETPLLPDRIRVFGGHTTRECDLVLEAVGREADGTIKPIKDLSYKPKEFGWDSGSPETWTTVTDEKSRQLAVETVFRWFRVKVPFKIPGGPEIKILEHILPMLTQQVRTASFKTEDGQKVDELPAWLHGEFLHGSAAGQIVLEQQRERIRGDAALAANLQEKLWIDGFEIDAKRGLVKLGRPAYRYDDRNPAVIKPMLPAKLWLRVGVRYKDPKTRGWVRESVDRRVTRRAQGLLPLCESRDDIRLKSYLEFTSSTKSTDNKAEFERQANYYLDIMKRKLDYDMPQTAVYPGLHNIPLDGAIQQATWYINDDGTCFTRASRNKEEAIVGGTYEQRQQIARVADIIRQTSRQRGDKTV